MIDSHLVFVDGNKDESCQRYYWMPMFVFMVALVTWLILISESVDGVFHYICMGVFLLKCHWIWNSVYMVTILLLVW